MNPIIFAGFNILAQTSLSMPLLPPSNEIYKQFYESNSALRIFKCTTDNCKDSIKQAWQKGFSLKDPIQGR